MGIGLAAVATASVLLAVFLLTREKTLNGMLVDLELNGPDPQRYEDLRSALTNGLAAEPAAVANLRVTLDYVHFSQLTSDHLNTVRPGFLLLSPQGTPWYQYRGKAAEQLRQAQQVVIEAALERNIPVLGICGGHQFLALAFGGEVDFIDPTLVGTSPARYPKEAIAERGSVLLYTLRDDPLFSGVTSHPGTFQVVQSHYEEVKTLPSPFVNIARSALSEIQIMRIPGKAVYGVAFHPERGWTEAARHPPYPHAGKRMLANFLTMAAQGYEK
jgi:GMP synthase-like glutamine amidotransferase